MNVLHGLAVLIIVIAIAKWYNWNQMQCWYNPENRENPQNKKNRNGRL